jgi:hypothetical protein
MRRTVYVAAVAALSIGLAGCSTEPSTTSADSVPPKSVSPPPVAKEYKPEPRITVPAGTKLRVALLDAVSSDKSEAGDQFMASLTEPVVVDGKTVFAKGTKVRGRVIEAAESGRVKGRAMLELTLTQVVRNEGKSLSISTKPYTVVAEPTKKRDTAIIGGGAGVGAAIGALAGGGKGAAIGAAVGGGAGTGTVLATKGKEIRFGPEHPLSFTLAASIQI